MSATQTNTNLQVTRCGHVFHRKCIYNWIDHKQNCPNCKSKVTAAKLNQLYLTPLDTVKHVLSNPECLQESGPDVLKEFVKKWGINGASNDDNPNQNNSNENNNSSNDSNELNRKLMKFRLEKTAMEAENTELEKKLKTKEKELKKLKRNYKELNDTSHAHLQTAQHYENKYFDSKEKNKQSKRELFKANKELINLKEVCFSCFLSFCFF